MNTYTRRWATLPRASEWPKRPFGEEILDPEFDRFYRKAVAAMAVAVALALVAVAFYLALHGNGRVR